MATAGAAWRYMYTQVLVVLVVVPAEPRGRAMIKEAVAQSSHAVRSMPYDKIDGRDPCASCIGRAMKSGAQGSYCRGEMRIAPPRRGTVQYPSTVVQYRPGCYSTVHWILSITSRGHGCRCGREPWKARAWFEWLPSPLKRERERCKRMQRRMRPVRPALLIADDKTSS